VTFLTNPAFSEECLMSSIKRSFATCQGGVNENAWQNQSTEGGPEEKKCQKIFESLQGRKTALLLSLTRQS
jgi:hypothetical protein